MKNVALGTKKKKKKKGSPDLVHILAHGKKAHKDFFAVYWSVAANQENSGKLFLGVSKRALAKAHERNRAKRLIREIHRAWLRKAKKKYHIMIRITKTPAELKTARFKAGLDPLLGRLS